MHEKIGGDAVSVDSYAPVFLSLSSGDYAHDHDEEDGQYGNAADKAPFLADSAEDEVGALLRNEIELGLRALQETLACESAGADGYPGLVDVVAGSHRVLGYAQQILDAVAVMRFEHVVEYEVHGEYQGDGYCGDEEEPCPAPDFLPDADGGHDSGCDDHEAQNPVFRRGKT